MKTLFYCLLFCFITNHCLAQKKVFPILDEDNRPVNYGVNSLRSKITLHLSVDAFTKAIKPFNTLPNDSLGTIVYLENAQTALLTVRLRKDSLEYYRYTVIEDDTKVLFKDAVPNKVHFTWNERSSWPGYLTMDLGISRIKNKKITVKIYRLPDAEAVTTLILYNKPLQRARVNEATIRGATTPAGKKLSIKELRSGAEINVSEQTKGIYISMLKTDLDFVYTVHVVRLSVPDSSHIDFASFPVVWKYDSMDGNPYSLVAADYFKKPGLYKVYVAPQIGDTIELSKIYGSVPQLEFRVREIPKVYTGKDILIIAALILLLFGIIGALIFFISRRRNLKKLQIAQRKAEGTKMQLDQIRSQLNPHFVYNALSGIQNLINQKEVEHANSYLSKFARLTRNVLNEQDLVSIEDERSLLDDYLAMERLRFNFNYEIKVDEAVSLLHVEIPTMLLQPFVENASKHSMSTLGNEGSLLIQFKSAQKDLILTIKDNGRGFDVNQDYEGLGLKLCKKRIDLLNELYPECPILLEINSSGAGTEVTITLKNWL